MIRVILITPSQAAERQERCKQRKHSYRFPHVAIDMEWAEDGCGTGNYRCRAYGAAVDPPPKVLIGFPRLDARKLYSMREIRIGIIASSVLSPSPTIGEVPTVPY